MGLPWIRLDTSMFDHPKLLDLAEENAHRAIVLHVAAMAYSGKHGTDGYVPKAALRVLGGRQSDVTQLLKAELWRVDASGWRIHGWAEYQLSDDDSKARAARARKGGCIRNHGRDCGCWQRDDLP